MAEEADRKNVIHRDLRDVMARRVPPPTADYYFGAADDEITMGDNERAFRQVRLNPRMGVKLVMST